MRKDTLLLDVLKKYQLRIDAFQVRADIILNNIHEKYPRLSELRKTYAMLRTSERASADKDAVRAEYEKVFAEYEAFLGQCLKKENVREEDVQYQPLCKICGDTGYVGDLQKKYCSCVVAQAAQNMLEGSNINSYETIENYNLSLFSDETAEEQKLSQKEMMAKLLDYIKSWTASFPECEKKQILISGTVGLGKSYCLNAIAYETITRGYSAMMVTAFSVNEAAFDEIKNSDSGALNMMRDIDLLLIDDLGSEQVLKNITCPTLFNVLNERTRRNRSTIISTNLSAADIEERYGSRVYSRLIDKNRTIIFPLSGKDIRSKV